MHAGLLMGPLGTTIDYCATTPREESVKEELESFLRLLSPHRTVGSLLHTLHM